MKRFTPYLFLSFVFLVACQATPVETESPTEALPPQAEVAPTETPYSEFPRAVCCEGKEIPSDLYRLPRWFSPLVTFEIPDGWRGVRENSVEAVYMIRGESEFTQATQVIAFFALDTDEPAEQFEQELLLAPQVTVIHEPTQVSIAGFDAWQVDLQALPNPEELGKPDADVPPGTQRISVFEDYFVTRFYFWYTFTPEAMVRVIVLNDGGQDLVFYLEASSTEFDALASDADKILQTLKVVP